MAKIYGFVELFNNFVEMLIMDLYTDRSYFYFRIVGVWHHLVRINSICGLLLKKLMLEKKFDIQSCAFSLEKHAKIT